MARQDEVTRSLSAATISELRCIAQLARTQVATLCRSLGLRDYDAEQAAKAILSPADPHALLLTICSTSASLCGRQLQHHTGSCEWVCQALIRSATSPASVCRAFADCQNALKCVSRMSALVNY